MEEENGPDREIPQFITNVIHQLISLKTNLNEADILDTAEEKEPAPNVLNDICVFADKIKVLIDKVKATTDNINKTFHSDFKDFKRKRRKNKQKRSDRTNVEAVISNDDETSEQTASISSTANLSVTNAVDIAAEDNEDGTSLSDVQKLSDTADVTAKSPEKEKPDSKNAKVPTSPLRDNEGKENCATELDNSNIDVSTVSADTSLTLMHNASSPNVSESTTRIFEDSAFVHEDMSNVIVDTTIASDTTTSEIEEPTIGLDESVSVAMEEKNSENQSNEKSVENVNSANKPDDDNIANKSDDSSITNKSDDDNGTNKVDDNNISNASDDDSVTSKSDEDSTANKSHDGSIESKKDGSDAELKTDNDTLESKVDAKKNKADMDESDDDKDNAGNKKDDNDMGSTSDDGTIENKASEETDNKPKFGVIKCIDISKLLDPNIKIKSNDSVKPLHTKNNNAVKNDSTIILLSSSDSELERNSRVKKGKQGKKDKGKKSDNKYNRKVKREDGDDRADTSRVESAKSKKNEESKIKCDSSSDSGRIRTRRKGDKVENSRTVVNKTAFAQLKRVRQARLARKVYIESSLSDDSSSDSDRSLASFKKSKSNHKAREKGEKTKFKLPDWYNYREDVKFKCDCYVSLPRIPVEQLRENYLLDKEQKEIDRLTNMKTLKRSRQERNPSASGSSDSDTKNAKKRSKSTKLDVERKSDVEDDAHEPLLDKDEEILVTNSIDKETCDEPPIPENLLASSDGQSDIDKESDKDDKTDEAKPKEKKKKDDTKEENEKKESDIGSDSDTTKDKSKTETSEPETGKSKWRNDKLLRGKLDVTDSEEEEIRFRKKKDKISKEIHSGADEETVITKKRKTKNILRRIARRLGSDSDLSADSDNNEGGKKSSNSDNQSDDDRNKKSSSSSDSEEELKERKKSRRRIKRMKDSEGSSDDAASKAKKKEAEEEEQSTRKKIRNVWNRDSLAETTKQAAKEEEERKKRIADRQKLYNDIYVSTLDENAKVDKLVLDFDEETKEELLSVHLDLVAQLKPHQAKGVQFMWTACFESLERANNTEGSGCILAHCMGLGKTLQVITLIHTLLTNTDKTKVRTVMVVCPLSTVLNWVAEFKKWLEDLDGEQVNVFDLVAYKQNGERLYQLQDWMKHGGVLIIGYDMFRNLSSAKGKRMSKKLQAGFAKTLLEPGPDMVVCDEGHLLKNSNTGISIAMNKLKTMRRIVLTGTPLQNNLKEYFCMVQFVKPNLLGTYKEYLNRFVNPITNGQYTDSTQHDIQIMRRRAHVLHKMLDGVVERRDYNVLAPFLPPKHEYVLFVTLTKVQCELYREYLEKFARKRTTKGSSFLFTDFQELQRICIHPRVLLDKSQQDKLRKEMDDEDSEGSLKDFIDDDSEKSTSTNGSSSESDADKAKPPVNKRRTRANPGSGVIQEEVEIPCSSSDEWWEKYCQNDELDNIKHSSKLTLLFNILHQCELIGDKILVFSQSLYSLNLLEYFLAQIDKATQAGESLDHLGGHPGSWALGLDYFRLDGSASCDNRAAWCKSFNNETNTRARLFLISTRAGGLGINLVAANRVIIFDVSWNPSYDIQSIYRVYRFGQRKPCYVYRFVTLGTMENKIYERQVTKQAISKRVIDEQQIDRHYNQHDLNELYVFNPIPEEERPTPLVPKDRLFADMLQLHDQYIFKYHEHNSLLENKADEGLNEEERRTAWEEFENEKKAPQFNLMQTMARNGMYDTLRVLVQDDNPTWTPGQVNQLLPVVVQRISDQVARGDYSMYRRVEEKHQLRVMELKRMRMIYQQYIQQLSSTNVTPDASILTQLQSTYNQLNAQHQQQFTQQRVAGTSAETFTFDNLQANGAISEPLVTTAAPTAPIPHPNVNEVVELNDD